MSYALFIDDERFPPEAKRPEGNWVVVRSSHEAINYVKNHGAPAFISFDHDLGGSDTSMNFLNWFISMYLDLIDMEIDPKLIKFPKYEIHSQNPVGAEAIRSKIESFKKHLSDYVSGYNLPEA